MVLATKLYAPPTRPEGVPRPRLHGMLERGARGGALCLLSAPAGFGKTTAVVQWLAREGRPHAWLSLDAADNDFGRFWRHVLAALERVWPGVGEAARARLGPPEDTASLDALLNEVAAREVPDDAGRPLVLVLDDYHVLHGPALHRSVDYLLDHLPPQLALVVATRTDPPLSLPRRRVRGLLTEVRAADLRFSSEEAAAFLNDVMGLALDPDDVQALEARTEGWIASLHLAALSLQRHDDPDTFIRSFTGSDRHVVDYLAEEVLARQPRETAAFLLATALPDHFCAALADALRAAWPEEPATSTHALIEAIERDNLFLVPLDAERRWFRYHHLFADLLRLRLARDHDALRPALHRRAGRWFAEQGLVDDAVGHALAAGDVGWAADLVEREGMALIARLGRPVPPTWLEALPTAAVRERPMLAVVHAWSLLLRQPMLMGDPEALARVEGHLADAEHAVAAGGHDPALAREVEGHVRVARAHLARYRNDVEAAVRLSRAELERLPPGPGLLRSGTAFNLGLAYLAAGDAPAAVATFHEAERATTDDDLYVRVGVVYMRALVLWRTGRLRESYALCDATLDALAPPDAAGTFPSYAGSHFVGRGRVLFEWDRLEEAEGELRTGLEHVARSGDPLIEANGRALLARTLHARGDAGGARAELHAVLERLPRAEPLVRAVRLDLGEAPPPGDEPEAAPWAAEGERRFGAVMALDEWPFALWLARGRRLVARHADGTAPLSGAEARALTGALARQADRAEAEGWTDRAIEVQALQAVARAATGEPQAALAVLGRALAAGCAEGYVRRFVGEGVRMARLLYRLAEQRGAGDPTAAHAARLLAHFPDPVPASPAPPPDGLRARGLEPLTPREEEVLQRIAEGLTNQEIADRLFISYETVKVHARNVYAKLDVRGRTEAVARARSLGLLPTG